MLRRRALLAGCGCLVAASAGRAAPPPDLVTLLGRTIVDADGAEAGRIADVLVGASGQVDTVIVDQGGFMGVGQRRVAVAWRLLQVTAKTVTVMLSSKAVAALPDYVADGPAGPAAP